MYLYYNNANIKPFISRGRTRTYMKLSLSRSKVWRHRPIMPAREYYITGINAPGWIRTNVEDKPRQIKSLFPSTKLGHGCGLGFPILHSILSFTERLYHLG